MMALSPDMMLWVTEQVMCAEAVLADPRSSDNAKLVARDTLDRWGNL